MSKRYSAEMKAISQESLQEALFELMQFKSFASISISELSQRAGISRMGFYRNYDTKEAVLADYFDRCVDDFYRFWDALPPEKKQPEFISQAYFQFVDENSQLFQVLVQSGAEMVLVQRFSQRVNEFYNNNVSTIPFTDDYAHYWNSFVSAGLYSMTMNWIRDGKKAPRTMLAEIAKKVAG